MKILLLDIETAPNMAAVYSLKQRYIQPSYIVEHGYVLCFSAKWLGKKGHVFHASTDGHEKMLREVHALLMEADAVVHYNGKKFDIPTLNAEFLMYGLPPIHDMVQIDLFRLAKSNFNFPSYKLDYVCSRLHLGTKVRHKGIQLWYDCMEGNAKAWQDMKRYNNQDVVLLEKLYKKLRPWMPISYGFKRIDEYLNGLRKKP